MAKYEPVFAGIESVVFGADDLGSAKRLFADWGLKKKKDDKSGVTFATEIGSEVVIRPSASEDLPPRLSGGSEFREVIWGVTSKKHLERLGDELARDRAVTEDKDGTLHTADDLGINIGFRLWRHGKEPTEAPLALNMPGARGRIDKPSPMYERAHPFRMGHIVFAVPDVRAGEKFYVKRLGFHLSDRYAGGAAVFLRYAARADHHNLFLLKRPGGTTDIHHVAFEVHDIHEVFGGGMHFSQLGYETAVGPGRHPISSAYFWYFKNPLGGTIEYFSNPDYVTEAWKPSNFRVNHFSEWHLAEGLKPPEQTADRPSLRAARAMN
jgi:catechol 2,3-dioxygenase-like lactoylglutathione lyase family enzyme